MRPLAKFLWFLLAFFAFVSALEALRYVLPHVPFPAELSDGFFTVGFVTRKQFRKLSPSCSLRHPKSISRVSWNAGSQVEFGAASGAHANSQPWRRTPFFTWAWNNTALDDDQGVARRAGFDLKYIPVAQVLNGGPF